MTFLLYKREKYKMENKCKKKVIIFILIRQANPPRYYPIFYKLGGDFPTSRAGSIFQFSTCLRKR